MSSPTEMPGIDISDTFAPIYWGFVISLFLGGMTIVQAYVYFPARSDTWTVRATAASMLVFDLTSSALVAQSVYYYLIPYFGSLKPLNSITPELSAECLLSTIITFISQLYFVHQLYVVRRQGIGNWFMIVVITVLAIFAFVGGVACVATMYIFHTGVLANRNGTFAIFFGLAKGFGAATDIVATAAMCIFLSSSKTGISQTNSLVNALIQFTIHRGALVTLIQTLLLITFYSTPQKLYWLAFHINVTKLYANTYFAMLNGRQHLKEKHMKHAFTASLNSAHGSRTNGRDKSIAFRNAYDLDTIDIHHDEESQKSMPTVTKTVVISDM